MTPDTPTPAARPTPADIDLVELRVGLAGLTAEVQRMRADVAPLAALPTQLAAVAELHAERLRHLDDRVTRELESVRAELAAEAGRRRAAVESVEKRVGDELDQVRDWQTWAIRVVLALVAAAVLGLVFTASGP